MLVLEVKTPPPCTPAAPLLQRRQMLRQCGETVEVVDREEVVDEGQGGLDAAREGLVVGGAEQRVQPDQAMGAALEAGDLVCEQRGSPQSQPSLMTRTTAPSPRGLVAFGRERFLNHLVRQQCAFAPSGLNFGKQRCQQPLVFELTNLCQ